jgi:hypothetical protein
LVIEYNLYTNPVTHIVAVRSVISIFVIEPFSCAIYIYDEIIVIDPEVGKFEI